MVADPSEGYRRGLIEALERDGDIVVVGETGDGQQLLNLVAQHQPHLILMEMNLESMDGIEVLEQLPHLGMESAPKILVVSSFLRGTVTQLISELGVDYYLSKPCQSLRIGQRIRQLTRLEQEGGATAVALEQKVSTILQKFGMPAHIRGYHYLRWAICTTTRNPELLHGVTKILYPMVAKEFGSTASRVERSIRHAIDMAWIRGDMEVAYGYFGSTISSNRGRPTNSEFIAMISDKLRLEEQIG